MSHRRAKAVRQELFPIEKVSDLREEGMPRVSRGAFLRASTGYVRDRRQEVLTSESPRAIMRAIKQRVKEIRRGT